MDIPSTNKLESRRLILPILSSSFAHNTALLLILWPLWWILGVEQFILLIFVSIEAIRHLFRKQGVFTINPAFVFSLFLSLWSAIPSLWITPDQVPVFLKGLSSTFAMTILIGLFISNVRSADEWWVVAKGLMVFAAYFATAAVLYVFGIWRGTFRSGMGRVLPNSLLTSSAFFDSHWDALIWRNRRILNRRHIPTICFWL